ncbi:DEAD/DEAH box ATP-dependent RNA helicase, putative [Plasmodium gallinaceum]|uniref:DEAD/DEAH box ATP-dependent RNA helicase, putative n=1 Tax=Plasmodium gallinaceum TaxID=5849 RepID=A0A1J1GY06_PLAGA|nr:DEAD/DEAH box ATP-dependent RNA helicase, putative [Plasmodium gallinaceum]CRG97144.1 DEAD/DEAH box ATP-dependent RNA helicase, putative [Plasmodium gallinaceum]
MKRELNNEKSNKTFNIKNKKSNIEENLSRKKYNRMNVEYTNKKTQEEKVIHKKNKEINVDLLCNIEKKEIKKIKRNNNEINKKSLKDKKSNFKKKIKEINNEKSIKNNEDSLKNTNIDDNNKNNIIDKNSLWSDLYISRPFLKVLYELKFNNPTFIQKDVIPLALEGKSILANSETGSGKTLAFVLPILERLLHSANVKMRKNNPKSLSVTKSLILLPTRELALQCYDVIRSLTKYVLITYSLFCGGIDIKQQEYEYKKKKDIFICTPGRILDLLLNSSSDFINFLEIVVFDEADKLLELGFKEECLKILDVCKYKKQILFFSATLTNDIKELVNFSLKNPIFIQSGENCEIDKKFTKGDKILKTFKISENLNQEFVNIVQEKYRKAALLYLCSNIYKNHAIIFFKTKRETHLMHTIFKLLNFKCAELHGSLTQKKRIESILMFKKKEVNFLLTTELASRGLDIDHVLYVINYNIPSNVVKYVHRIGRTARIGKKGTASTLYLLKEKIHVKKIIKGLKKNKNLKIFKRNIAKDNILHWYNILKKNKEKIKEIIEQEKTEKEIEKSKKSIEKIKNLITYKDEILNRPPRTWFLTKKEKIDLKKSTKKNNELNDLVNGKKKLPLNENDNNSKNNRKVCKLEKNKKIKNNNEEKKKLKSYQAIIKDLKLNILHNKNNSSKNILKNNKNEVFKKNYMNIRKNSKRVKKLEKNNKNFNKYSKKKNKKN